jgi:uncharacterized protein (TIGR03437 family)
MKRYRFGITLLICFVFTWTSLTAAGARWRSASPARAGAQAQLPQGSWIPVGGPYGGTTNDFINFGDGAVMAATGGGVFYTMDNGETWQPRNNGLTGSPINALALAGTVVFAATLNGVFRTANRGILWTPITIGLAVTAVLVLKYIGSTLYAGTNGGGVFIFNGQSWEARNTGLTNLRVNAIKAIGAALVLGTDGGIFRSLNGGGNWAFSNAGLAVISITALACIGTTLFAGTDGQGVWRSTNEGASWLPANTGATNLRIRSLHEADPALYAGATAGLFRSTTNGGSWTQLGATSLPATIAVRAVLLLGTRLFVGLFANGVYRSDNQGQTFAEKNRGLAAAEVRGLGVAPRQTCAGFAAQQTCFPIIANTLNGPVISYDGGRTWKAVNDGLPDTSSQQGTSLLVTPTNVYQGSNGGLFRAPANNPVAWTKINGVDFPLHMVASPNIINIATPNGVIRIIESPFMAERVTTAGLTNSNVQTISTVNNSTYIGTGGGGIFELVNDRWEPRNGGDLTDLRITGLLALRDRVLAGDQTGRLFRRRRASEALIEQWVRVHVLNDARLHKIIEANLNSAGSFTTFEAEADAPELQSQNTLLLAGSLGGGALISTNQGESWQPFNQGLGNLNVFDFAVLDGRLYAATGGGVYVFANAAASVSAASYSAAPLAAESIVTAFGVQLAVTTQSAATLPLPTVLAGTQISVRDSLGVERLAPQFFISPLQANFQMPLGTALGTATITFTAGNGAVATGTANIANVAPGLFSANANGQGVAAAFALRVKADGSQTYEPIARFDATANRFVPLPIDLGPASEQVYLVAFGTGFKFRSALTAVSLLLGGMQVQVTYAGPQGDLVGLDQLNALLSRNLMGRGEIDIALTVDGRAANLVRLNIK